MDMGEKYIGQISVRHPKMLQVFQAFGGGIDQNAQAIDPDHKTGEVTRRIKAMTCTQRCHPEARAIRGKANGATEGFWDAFLPPAGAMDLKCFRGDPPVYLGDGDLE